MRRHLHALLCSLFMTSSLWANPSRRFQKIDALVLSIDRQANQLVQTEHESCEVHSCVKTISYWGADDQLRKVLEVQSREDAPGLITARYYQSCRLILVREAPDNESAVKDPQQVAKYYFHKGKLLQVTFGSDVKTFPPDQWAYYERTKGLVAPRCTADKSR